MAAPRNFLTSRVLQWVLGGVAITTGATHLATRDTHFKDFSPSEDDLFNNKLYKRSNPNNNPTLHDLCMRSVPLSSVRPDLLEDAKSGGMALAKHFCRSMWSGYAFAIQRIFNQLIAERGRSKNELWTKTEIQGSDIEVGLRIAGEFEVVEIKPTAVILRGGQPRKLTSSKDIKEVKEYDLQDVDVFAEVGVHVDFENEVAEFQFKGIFFCGTGEGSSPPLPEFLDPLHRLYA